jgi:hypothetical protein
MTLSDDIVWLTSTCSSPVWCEWAKLLSIKFVYHQT